MGTKAAVMYAFCSVFALVLQSIATQVKWHALRVMNGVTTHTILKMETGLLFTRVDTGSSLLCFYKDNLRLKPGMCDRLAAGITLQDAADEWCSPLLVQTFPSPCEGFKAAYFVGLGTMMAMAIHVILVIVCLFLIAQYLEGTLHKGVYRVWALILHVVATIMLLATYLVYILVAIQSLDNIAGQGIQILASASKGSGTSLGVLIMGAGLVFQILSAAILFAVKLGDEETSEEKKIRQWMKEDAKYAQEGGYVGDYGSYGYGQPQQAAGYAGYGYDPNQFVAGGYPPQGAAMEMPGSYAATSFNQAPNAGQAPA